ncbi:hypothetical protein AB0K14_33950 [Actinosynnema sp. NPDC050801]|uniref:hypothetical protein n=1 Tax=unclassified Actinosynnema TaxID=2637065 RepID=UPI0033CA331D
MKYVAVQVVGMVLLVLGAQGAIRLLLDHDRSGLLGWVPGGFAVWLSCYVVGVVVGAVLAGWGNRKAKRVGAIGG